MSIPFDVMCVGEVVFVSLSTRCNHINCIKCSISQLTPLISLFKFFVRNEFFYLTKIAVPTIVSKIIFSFQF